MYLLSIQKFISFFTIFLTAASYPKSNSRSRSMSLMTPTFPLLERDAACGVGGNYCGADGPDCTST